MSGEVVMKHSKWIARARSPSVSLVVVLFAITCCSTVSNGQSTIDSAAAIKINPPTTDEMLKKVDRLVQQNEQLEKQHHELMSEITAMRRALAEQSHASSSSYTGPQSATRRFLSRSVVLDQSSTQILSWLLEGRSSSGIEGNL